MQEAWDIAIIIFLLSTGLLNSCVAFKYIRNDLGAALVSVIASAIIPVIIGAGITYTGYYLQDDPQVKFAQAAIAEYWGVAIAACCIRNFIFLRHHSQNIDTK
jgi:integral membrane sensor domain MASE1